MLYELDVIIFNWINQYAGRFPVLDEVMIFSSKLFIYILITALIIGVMISKHRITYLAGIAGMLLGLGIKQIIELIYVRPRPFVSYDIQVLIEKEASASFPSITTLVAFVAATTIWINNKKLGFLLFIVAALVAISRVFVGHHYPSDVFVGSMLGIVITYICYQLIKRITMEKS